MILAGLHPNTTKTHVQYSRDFLAGRLDTAKAIEALETQLTALQGVHEAIATDSARSAITIALTLLDLPPGSNIAVSAYTCIVVRNAILAAGHRPCYIDIDDSLSIDPVALASEQTPIAALMLQHTFGIVSKHTESLIAWAKEHNVVVLEDAAHVIDSHSTVQADIRIISFGPEKPISAIRGGAILIQNKQLGDKAIIRAKELPACPQTVSTKLARTQILFGKLRRCYPARWTKLLFRLQAKRHRTIPILQPVEVAGAAASWTPAKISPLAAFIAHHEISQLSTRNQHRQTIAGIYREELPADCLIQKNHISGTSIPLEIAVRVGSPSPQIISALRQKHIHLLPSWLGSQIVPARSMPSISDEEKRILATKTMSKEIVHSFVVLPTHHAITEADAKTIAKAIKPYV